LSKLRKVSGETAVKILCNKFGFEISGRSGSHVRLSKMTSEGKVGTVVPSMSFRVGIHFFNFWFKGHFLKIQ